MQKPTNIEDNSEVAFNFHNRLISLKKAMGIAFVSIGDVLKLIRDEKYYKTLGHDSFVSYVQSPEVGLHYRTAYYYIEIYEVFIEQLSYTREQLINYSYDKLRKLLPIIRREEDKEKVMERASSLSWGDFEKIYKDEKENKNHTDYLEAPEFYRCSDCGRWVISIPVTDCCEKFLKDFYILLKKKRFDKEREKG